MASRINKIIIVILAAIFFAFGSGITICKMVCLSSGDIEFAVNEEAGCCDDTEKDGCCNDETASENPLGCCTHTDNSLVLDQYVPSGKVFVEKINCTVNALFIFNSTPKYHNIIPTAINYTVPIPLPAEDISSFTHLFLI